ncbi:hypothetical protein FNV43_RR21887 [Rhamnella rubrinervis]|uniref:GDSL esterase/lipase n=1 Tax=Rhamnella rubrinervis TaxID=2594499 RepID=A0A8K0GRJ8_9ROSA|nr:hypothetical protein FNV43_RR21887 [Rhamnella rubrinervis]
MIPLPPAKAAAPAIFVFGDSTADVGTNSFLPGSEIRANFPHNGVDFPHSRATGRFSNGLIGVDFLAKYFGYKRSPPRYLSLNSTTLKKRSFTGINFASAGAGVFDIPGQSMLTLMNFGKEKIPFSTSSNNQKNFVTMREQAEQFLTVRDNVLDKMVSAATKKFLSKCLFFISIGSNAILAYYHSRKSIPKTEFLDRLGLAYRTHLKSLLNLGAIKFGIISVAPLGCCPSQRVSNDSEGCLEDLNELLDSMLWDLSLEHEDMKYSLGNAYEMTINVIGNPSAFEFKDVKSACCGAGKFNATTICNKQSNLCLKRDDYLFWDSFHPTHTASKLAAITLFSGPPRFVTPINFSQLA